MATKLVACPECDAPLGPGRFACSSCGTILAAVASVAGRFGAAEAAGPPVVDRASPAPDDARELQVADPSQQVIGWGDHDPEPLAASSPHAYVPPQPTAGTPSDTVLGGPPTPRYMPRRRYTPAAQAAPQAETPDPDVAPAPVPDDVSEPADAAPAWPSAAPAAMPADVAAPVNAVPAWPSAAPAAMPAAAMPAAAMPATYTPAPPATSWPETPAWPPRETVAPVAHEPIAPRTPAGAYLPPSAVLPPGEALPVNGTNGHPAGVVAPRADAGSAKRSLAERFALGEGQGPLGLQANAASRTIAIGASIAGLGLLLPWAEIVIGSSSIGGFLDQWGLAGPGHPLILLLLVAVGALAVARERFPDVFGAGTAAIVLGSVLLGLVFPYVMGPYHETIGVYVTGAGAVVMIVGGLLARVTPRHAEAVETV